MSAKLTILVVDDDPVIRTLLVKYLEKSHHVFSAENGIEALDIIQQQENEVDIVLSDMEMPQLDGLGLVKRVRAEYPKICVIMISGSKNTRDAIQAIREGAYDYISKPLSDLEEVDIILRRWQKQQTLEAKLAKYASLHSEMMLNMKVRTFLAVDVCDSAKLKKDEDPFIVQYLFKAYQEFIKTHVEKSGGTIYNTSGDGAMACFEEATNAIEAARQIESGLYLFNLNENQFKGEFTLRIGLHTGQVIINEDGDINEMFSESLDIAGHIQKSAGKNHVLISEATLKALGDPAGFTLSDKKIDGFPLYRMTIVDKQ